MAVSDERVDVEVDDVDSRRELEAGFIPSIFVRLTIASHSVRVSSEVATSSSGCAITDATGFESGFSVETREVEANAFEEPNNETCRLVQKNQNYFDANHET
jgi:hypothetical protein